MTYGSISQAFIDKFIEQEVTDSQIELGIRQTTGPGNTVPSAHLVLSYLLNFDIIPSLMGRSAYQPILRYISLKYRPRPLDRDDTIVVLEHSYIDHEGVKSNYGNPI